MAWSTGGVGAVKNAYLARWVHGSAHKQERSRATLRRKRRASGAHHGHTAARCTPPTLVNVKLQEDGAGMPRQPLREQSGCAALVRGRAQIAREHTEAHKCDGTEVAAHMEKQVGGQRL